MLMCPNSSATSIERAEAPEDENPQILLPKPLLISLHGNSYFLQLGWRLDLGVHSHVFVRIQRTEGPAPSNSVLCVLKHFNLGVPDDSRVHGCDSYVVGPAPPTHTSLDCRHVILSPFRVARCSRKICPRRCTYRELSSNRVWVGSHNQE